MAQSPASILYDATGTNPVAVILDGSVYRLQMETKIVRASDSAQINPATQETLASLDGKDFATQTTLAAIKNTDGVKKITDPLPAGTNEIGKVAQGTKAVGSAAWSQVLYDASGNAIGVVLDGALYRLQADAKVAKGASALVHLDAIDTVAGKGRLKSTLYTADGDPVSFGSAPANPQNIDNRFATNGGADSLLVNGSVTPVVFTYLADATNDVSLQEIKFVMAANGITFGSAAFGSGSGPLTNGLLVEIVSQGNTGTVYNFKQNEGFVNFASPGSFQWVVASKDMMSATYVVGGTMKLIAASGDRVRVTVRDNLSSAALYLKCFVKGALLAI